MRLKLLAFLMLLSFQLVAVAQNNLPLVLDIDGQVYRWSVGDAEPTFTGCDLQGNRLRTHDYSLTVSADGNWAAFMVLPADMEDGAPTPTGNLWVCNLITGEAYALSNRRPESPNSVSEGAFSPDGSRIVWTEVDDQNPNVLTATMFIHDFSTKATQMLVESLPLDEYCSVGTGAPNLIWGEHGIVVGYVLLNADEPCSEITEIGFAHYSDDGTLLNSFPVDITYFLEFEWLAEEEPRIAFWGVPDGASDPQLYSLNMVTGASQAEVAALEAFIANSADTAGTYFFSQPYSPNQPPQIRIPLFKAIMETSTDVALSPDGQLMALLLGRTLYFGDDGTLRPASWNQEYFPINDENAGLNIPSDFRTGQLEVAWANPSYRLVPMPETVCPSVERLDIERGESVYVIEGLGNNNVRSAPYPDAETLGVILEGAIVTVIDDYNINPFQGSAQEVCTDGIRWREVLFEGQLGWTAEAQGDTYFLETR